jgi:hypothetical protein
VLLNLVLNLVLEYSNLVVTVLIRTVILVLHVHDSVSLIVDIVIQLYKVTYKVFEA